MTTTALHATPPSLPSYARLLRVLYMTNVPIVVGFAGYVAVAFAAPEARALRDQLVAYLAFAVVVSTAVTAVLGRIAYAPFARLRSAFASGVHVEGVSAADVRGALMLPRRVFWAMLAEWLVFALLWPVASLPVVDFVGGGELVLDLVVAGACVGLSGAVVALYVFDIFVARNVAPLLLPTGRIEHLHPFRITRTWHHLSLLTVTLGMTQPIAILTLTRHADSMWVGIYVVAFSFVIGAVQMIGIVSNISGGIGHLEERMREVRQGDLNVKALVKRLDTFGIAASHFNGMVEGLRQREMLREAFGRYVTKQVADEILAGRIELGGELRTATVLFSDIRGFTTMSEKMAPTEVVAFLNRYLDEMVDCVFTHGGILDKFIGDAVMAVFGVPVSSGTAADDAAAAVRCAIDMHARLQRLNDAREAVGEPRIEIGIGLHTGELVAGNIGSPKRMEYTVIGDTVNVTSRIEDLTKQVGRRVLMSAQTALLVKDRFAVEKVAEAPIRGRAQPVELYTVAL